MARRTKPVLPGLSRSTACSRTKSCQRLEGHKGPHRSSLFAVTKSPTATTKVVKAHASGATEGGVEVHSADRYTVQPEQSAKPTSARRTRRPKVVVIPMADYRRLVAAGIKVTKSRGYIVSGKPSARLA